MSVTFCESSPESSPPTTEHRTWGICGGFLWPSGDGGGSTTSACADNRHRIIYGIITLQVNSKRFSFFHIQYVAHSSSHPLHGHRRCFKLCTTDLLRAAEVNWREFFSGQLGYSSQVQYSVASFPVPRPGIRCLPYVACSTASGKKLGVGLGMRLPRT